MQVLPVLLSCLALIFFIEKSECSDRWRENSDIVFLDPIDYSLGKKSCSDGYVHGIDHFIVTGFINVTGYTLPKFRGAFILCYLHRARKLAWLEIRHSYFDLWTQTCTDIQQVPLNKCNCKYESAITIRVKCNLTALKQYSEMPFQMWFMTTFYSISSWMNMTKVYTTASCGTGSSTNGGMRPYGDNNGMPGHIFLVPALVFTTTSMICNGQ